METAAPLRIVVGLGNPGTKYEGTRHNAGFYFVEQLAISAGVDAKAWRTKGQALQTEIRIAGKPLLLAKPQTFMNLSGNAVLGLMAQTRAKPAEILVVCDDVLFEAGKVRIRASGSHGGQNGLRSIIGAIGSQFPRIRLGVGLCPADRDLSSHVLSRFSSDERDALLQTLDHAPQMVELMMTQGIAAAMNRWNGL